MRMSRTSEAMRGPGAIGQSPQTRPPSCGEKVTRPVSIDLPQEIQRESSGRKPVIRSSSS